MDFPALALFEFNQIPLGVLAGDAMVKRSPVELIRTGTVQPGHYLVLVAGEVATVQEAVSIGRETGQSALRDHLFLPNIHPQVVRALAGEQVAQTADAVGIVETQTVAAAIQAADAGVKGAEVTLLQLRLADGLGGKGLLFFTGLVADVEAAVGLATAVATPHLHSHAVIPQLHSDMWPNITSHGRFGAHFGWHPA